MKIFRDILWAGALLAALGACKPAAIAPTTPAEPAEAAPVTARTKWFYLFDTSAVSGAKLDPAKPAVTLVHDGYEVKVATQAEADEFTKNPAPYIAKIEQAFKDAKAYPGTTCLMCGMEVNKNSPAFVYDGRIFEICDPMCLEEFHKDPARYVKAWDEAAAKSAGAPK